MNSSTYKIARVIGATAAIVVLGFLFIAWSTYRAERRAERLLAAAVELQLRKASLGDIKGLAHEYNGKIWPNCTPQHCSVLFTFENRWIARMRLAPPTRLNVMLDVQEGVLDGRSVTFISGTGPAQFIAKTEEQPHWANPLQEPYRVGLNRSGNARWRVIVSLTPRATEIQRKDAYSFNVPCLYKLGGCEDAAILLPTIAWTGE